MLISTSHSFIFVHVPKSAGSSLTSALQPYCLPRRRGLLRRVLSLLPLREDPARAHFRQHVTAAAIRARIGPQEFARFTSFGVVRNPYDHAVSVYEFLKVQQRRSVGRKLASMSFVEFMRLRAGPAGMSLEPSPLHMPAQAHWLADDRDRLLVSRVLRVEHLDRDFTGLCRELGLPPTPLTARNVSRRQATGAYYDAETIALVRRIYARDFALFGYDPAPDFTATGN